MRKRFFSKLRRTNRGTGLATSFSVREPRPDISEYQLSDSSLATLSDEDLNPKLIAALRSPDPVTLRSLLTLVHPDIYLVTIFDPQWCHRMLCELDSFEEWVEQTGCRVETPNSMNNYGVILSQIGLGPMLDDVRTRVIGPMAALCFPEVGGASLEEVHGFVVEYQPRKDRSLGFHVDDSDVTLNLCLGREFSGGDLYFEGRRCERHRQTGCSSEDRFVWEHRVGQGLLHAGKHRHGAMPIVKGIRQNLILWCRSPTYRLHYQEADSCPDWCRESMLR